MYFIPHASDSLTNRPIEPHVLADLYAWLEAHSGLSHSFATTAAQLQEQIQVPLSKVILKKIFTDPYCFFL